jgi:hypothetical protein
VPDNCYVEQAVYAVRHGSRYPDSGAYNGWVAMQQRVSPSLCAVSETRWLTPVPLLSSPLRTATRPQAASPSCPRGRPS